MDKLGVFHAKPNIYVSSVTSELKGEVGAVKSV